MQKFNPEQIEPQILWQEFVAIANIPRCTGKEADILTYIASKAEGRGFETRQDSTGNLVVCLPATTGQEGLPGLIIQAHVDMVCEQNMGTNHDFEGKGITLCLEGDRLFAKGTTLGADNGIAVAMMLALIQGNYSHGPLELLFTVDEEGGLIGALKLDPSILKFRRLINLDSEEEGIFYIGCAGGMETVGELPLDWVPPTGNMTPARILITGLGGGHSGAEIHRQPGNSLVLAARVLLCVFGKESSTNTNNSSVQKKPELLQVFGGDRHNAIPREACIDLLLPEEALEDLRQIVKLCESEFRDEFAESERGLKLAVQTGLKELGLQEYPQKVMDHNSAITLSRLMNAIPHGVLSMSRIIEGLVSTSSNFASMYIKNGKAIVLTSQRSDYKSLLKDAGNRTIAPFILAGGTAYSTREYSGWQPNSNSALLQSALKVWKESSGAEAQVRSIHAGLECGVIGAKLGEVDMLSFGPNIWGAHTPEESTSISSCSRVFSFFLKFLLQFD